MRLTSPGTAQTSVRATGPLSSVTASAAVIAALLLVFLLDRVTGSAPMQHLYYLPIIFAGISFRMRGLTAAFAAIVLYHLANPHLLTLHYEEADVVQIALFIAVGVTSAKLTDNAQRLHALAMTDDLTGLHNLRSFEARLATMIRQGRATGTPVSLLVLDVDRLKSLNDTHGHLTGAEAVRTVGHLIGVSLPPGAIASRYGGDEFVAALPGYPEDSARTIADDLRRTVNAAAPVLAGRLFPIGTLSISVGVACRVFDRDAGPTDVGDAESGEALFRAADAALYAAKESGRNHVSVA